MYINKGHVSLEPYALDYNESYVKQVQKPIIHFLIKTVTGQRIVQVYRRKDFYPYVDIEYSLYDGDR